MIVYYFECVCKSHPWPPHCIDKQGDSLCAFRLILVAQPPQYANVCSVWATYFTKDKSGRKPLCPSVSNLVPALSRGTGNQRHPLLITVSGRRSRTPSDLEQGWCRHLINNNISQRSSNYRPIPEAIKLLIWKKDCFLSLMNVNSSPEPKGDVYECPTVTVKSDYK